MSDVDYDEDQQSNEPVAPRKGGYDARVEQWLYENLGQLIIITEAGKDNVNFIQYTINCGVRQGRAHGRARANSVTGPGGQAQIFRVRLVASDAGESASNANYTAHSREALHGRLRCTAYQSKRGCGHNRAEEAHVGCLSEPLPRHEGRHGGWSLLALP